MYRLKVSKCFTLILAATALCGVASGQYTSSDAFGILTQDDGGFCRPQEGSWWPFYDTGCCGSPGNRVCARVLHAGKGSNGDAAGCTDPDDNRTQHGTCRLPDVAPMVVPPTMQPQRDASKGTDIWFLVTSDLHFYRDWYNVSDQAAHPYRMNQFAAAERNLGHPYGATMVVGDMTTGPSDDRVGAYRLLWEKQWLPGASSTLPVFPTLGNHDSDSSTSQMWDYIRVITESSFFNVDRNFQGCLVNVDPFCWDDQGYSGSMNYSFDWQGVHMVMLNTWAGDANQYLPPNGAQGMQWLTNDLSHNVGTSGRPVIIFQHYGINDNNTVDTGHNWWTLPNLNAFTAKLKTYNVIAWFSGHTHDLGKAALGSTVNANNGNSNGVGQGLDNLVDGAGGDCQHHGTNNVSEGSTGDNSTYCSGADANFFAVHVTDNTMTVRTMTYNDSKGVAPYEDSSIGLIGTTDSGIAGIANTGATCTKRFGRYIDVTAQVSMTVDSTNKRVNIANNSPAAIPGPLALAADGLSKWDFTDSCVIGTGKGFLILPNGGLTALGTASAIYNGVGGLSNLHLYQLDDSLVLGSSSILVGSQPVTVSLSTAQGRALPFTYSTPLAVVGTPLDPILKFPWKVTTDSATTPATLTVSLIDPAYAVPTTMLITASDPGFPTISLSLAPNAPLTLATNVPRALVNRQVYVPGSGVPVPVPQFIPSVQQVPPLEYVEFDVPSPQYPAAGTRYTFDSWVPGSGTHDHTFQVPLDGVTETVNFDVAYQVTTTATPGGTLGFSPPLNDGYYPANTQLIVAAQPANGYRLVGFTGAVSGISNPQTLAVTGPLTIGATFSNTVSVTIAAQPSNGIVYVDNVAYRGTNTFQWLINDKHQLDATRTDNGGGVHQAFQSWSTGQSAKSTFLVPNADTTITANFNVSYQLVIDSTTNGSISVSPASPDGYYAAGSEVTATATPAPNYYLNTFTRALNGSQNPQNLTMKGPEEFGATFQSTPSTTIIASPANGVVYVDNVAYIGTNSFLWVPGSSHTLDASKTDDGGGTHQAFVKWSIGKPASFSFTAQPTNNQFTATFAMAYQLTLNSGAGGTLAASPSRPDGYYADGTQVSVTATPAANYFFGSFTGAITGTANPQTVAMSLPRSVSAAFTGNPVTTISTLNDPLPVTVDGALMNTPAQVSWTPGTTHTIGMQPVISGGTGVQYLLVKWSDGVTTNSRSVVAGSSSTAYQLVTAKQLFVTAAANPVAGGTVTGGGWYTQGAQATLGATANGGYAFGSFSGDAPAAVSPDIFTVNAPASVVANFISAQPQLNLVTGLIDDSSSSILKLGLTVANTGTGEATGIQIVSITPTVLSGSGTVSETTVLPLGFGSLAGGSASASQEADFNWPISATRVRLTIKYAANGGTVSGTQTINLFR